jgi:hypothetical protein
MPFSEATARELAGTGMRIDPTQRAHPDLLPVTPEKVSIPLLNWKDLGKDLPRWGLFKLSELSFRKNRKLNPHRREFLLAQLNSPSRYRLLHIFTGDDVQAVGECLDKLDGSACKQFRWDASHWVWFEAGFPETDSAPQTDSLPPVIKLWDAEFDRALLAKEEFDPAEILRGTLAKDSNGTWRWEWDS